MCFLPFLGIKDLGDEPRIEKSPFWTECEAPGAGAWVKRDVAELYARRLETSPVLASLGRSGGGGMLSCDDSCMMRGAYTLGLANGYCPDLTLKHHLAPRRFTFPYVLELMGGYGPSQLVLEQGLLGEHPMEAIYEDPVSFSHLLDHLYQDSEISGRMKAAKMMWHLAARTYHNKTLANNEGLPSFSVVTPCLNAAPTIERTLKSIRDQGYPNLQYIVCDGGSTDGTLDILRAYEGMIDVLIVGKDANVADALNKGFARSTGEIRGYLNADDCLATGALRKVAAIFRNVRTPG